MKNSNMAHIRNTLVKFRRAQHSRPRNFFDTFFGIYNKVDIFEIHLVST